jgi:hypothetical protein
MGGRFDLTRSQALLLHPDARALAPAMVDDLIASCGDAVRLLPEGSRRPWVQDYCPLIVRADDGRLKQLTFISPHAGESRFFFEDLDADVVPLRLIMRGGGICLCGDNVFISRALADQNRVWPRGDEARERYRRGQFEPRTLEQVVGVFGDALDVDGAHIQLIAPMPGERTGHLTPVMRPLPDGRVVVPELTEEAFAQISYAHEIGVGRLVQTYLDVKAAELEGLGRTVVRLPMLPPIDLSRTPERPEGWVGDVHSTAAAALVAVGDVRRAYLPTFDDDAFPPGYKKLKAELLEACHGFYAEAGFEPILVDATAVAREGGSLPRLIGTVPA